MKKKRVLICVLLIIALLFSATNVFAALDDVDEPMIDNEYEPINTNTNQNRNENVNSANNNNNNANQNRTNTVKDGNNQMPNTGIEDLPIIAIGICIVSAAVAYTQIKRYNV